MSFEWTSVRLSAVALSRGLCRSGREDFVVMAANDGCHILHTAVADFDVISVEQFMVPMIARKMFVYECKELMSNVGGYVLVIWWVEPYNITFALLSSSSLWLFVCQLCIMSTFSQGFLVWGLSLVELLYVAGY